jgi:hypothetical protein
VPSIRHDAGFGEPGIFLGPLDRLIQVADVVDQTRFFRLLTGLDASIGELFDLIG